MRNNTEEKEEKPVISVDNWYVTPFGLKSEEVESRYPWKYPDKQCEVWAVDIFICAGDSDDDIPYIYLTTYLWIRVTESITDRDIGNWLSNHFGAIQVCDYRKLR